MAEQESKPTAEEPAPRPDIAFPKAFGPSRMLLPLGLALILTLVGCFWWGSQENDPAAQDLLPTATTEGERSPESSAAITRIASTLAEAQVAEATSTPTPISADSVLVVLPTVTPTLVPSPVATRTIELNGNATLRLQLDSDRFESDGQPVVIDVDPHSYVLGGDTLSQGGEWCMQIGPTGLVFDLTYTLNPITEDLSVNGELRLHDGFCGQWGSLGNVLTTLPVNIIVPAGSTAQIPLAMQVQGSFMGLPNVIDISTGVFLELRIRNPRQ